MRPQRSWRRNVCAYQVPFWQYSSEQGHHCFDRHWYSDTFLLKCHSRYIPSCNMVLNYTDDDQRYISAYLVASELGFPICCLQFSTYWKDNNISNIKIQARRTDRYVINFDQFSSLSLESASVVTSIQYVCYFMTKINQVQMWANYDIACLPKDTSSAQSINNFSSIFVSYFFLTFSSFIKNIKYNIEKSFSVVFTKNRFFSYGKPFSNHQILFF